MNIYIKRKIAKFFIKKLMFWAKMDRTLYFRNLFWNRIDEISMIDLTLANHKEQQAFPINKTKGNNQYGQIGHYTY